MFFQPNTPPISLQGAYGYGRFSLEGGLRLAAVGPSRGRSFCLDVGPALPPVWRPIR
ncbi:expressed unknown protein [Ectocarpus siliculosus]|uniref:Uncharacterized protein n=1 Tax=Ectocarpus siliculosus TaxID=2880 RepID=D8LLR7_ECTSI|nr:expressed unknown protein [Ectocarpus siliculosus]|eukprot:CBN74698.1 expressed unknown protein [Ectocarpus siliculosus]